MSHQDLKMFQSGVYDLSRQLLLQLSDPTTPVGAAVRAHGLRPAAAIRAYHSLLETDHACLELVRTLKSAQRRLALGDAAFTLLLTKAAVRALVDHLRASSAR